MLLESLQLLIHAGENALLTTCNLKVDQVTVAQVRQGQINFPAIAKIVFQGGTLQHVRLGADSALCDFLTETVQGTGFSSETEILASRFLSQSLENMEGRNPRGQVEELETRSLRVFNRGIRSFGLRFRTPRGHLFALVDLPSRMELESAKGGEFLNSMISTYLPRDWGSRENLATRSEIDSCLTFLRKAEADLHLSIPLADDQADMRTGVLVGRCKHGSDLALRVNLNLEHGPARHLQAGDRLTAFVGINDRSLEMELEFLAAEDFRLEGGSVLQTALFAMPDEMVVTQRRRAFRIDLYSTVPVEIEAIDEDLTSASWFGAEEPRSCVTGRLVDLSFSGCRIIGEANELCPVFEEGSRIRCRIFFPDESQPLLVPGIVRRSGSKLVARDTFQDELGLEFLVSPDVDRKYLDAIRQYVLKEQRTLLARRVHVSGSV